MTSASAIRLQIESVLARKIPSALTPAPKSFHLVAPSGVPALDALLQGGLPLGAITEMTGPESSGRTSVALSYLAGLTRAGRVCAWIDTSDSLHAESAAAAGVELSRLLWVRCGVRVPPDRASGAEFSLPENYRVAPPAKRGLHGGGFGNHPRTETRGISAAVENLFRSESLGPRCAESQPRRLPERRLIASEWTRARCAAPLQIRPQTPWARIERALKAADLLLQGGGFSAIVLDMAAIAPEHVSRIEISTWFRYRAAAERTQASLLLLTQHACAKSAGELLLRFGPAKARCEEKTVFAGIEHCVEVARRRFDSKSNLFPLKKPLSSESHARWQSTSPWAGAR
jgi:hypothetical protein